MRIQKRQVKTAPGDYELVSLVTMKAYLFETSTDQDAIITALITAAIQSIESGLDYSIDTSSLIYQYYDRFPEDGELPIWHPHIKTTDLVVEYWNDTAWDVVKDSDYRIDIATALPRVFLKSTSSWPTDISDDINSVRIGFKMDLTDSFLDDIKAAVMTWVAARYEGKEGEWNSSVMIGSVDRVIERHKLHS